ncbi:chemotaxis protein [Burkholderia sp. WAC0059]|uniref:chemotaxis protein CheC n=1 Tax=Burkholderia sp. WAC0059 TaxID=2066022 RepID=UPI000C7EC516|nr:chemotaxis protein CheC [Burkholderia sp. WAC0059]PLZ04136.1 chemotaxis protein [Burkholderia sp. WAC0059]
MREPVLTEDQRDALQELANLGMGTAASRLSRLLDSFIELSVPRVRTVALSEAAGALREMTGIEDSVTVVRQGFRSEIKGEVLVICRSAGMTDLAALVRDPQAEEQASETELIFDIANVLTGACVSSILGQLGLVPIFSAPDMLGEAVSLVDVFQPGMLVWNVALLVEVNLSLEDRPLRAHLVMLMAEESIRQVSRALDTLLQGL